MTIEAIQDGWFRTTFTSGTGQGGNGWSNRAPSTTLFDHALTDCSTNRGGAPR
jgi:hypothetical protein